MHKNEYYFTRCLYRLISDFHTPNRQFYSIYLPRTDKSRNLAHRNSDCKITFNDTNLSIYSGKFRLLGILSPQAKDLFSCKNPCLAVNEHVSDLLRQMILEEMQINSSSDNIYLRTIITIK